MSEADLEQGDQAVRRFMEEFCATVATVIEASGWVCYVVGPELQIKHFITGATQPHELEDYEQGFMDLDPISPARCLGKGALVASLQEEAASLGDMGERYLREFARPHQLVDAVEIFMDAGEGFHLGCSVLRHEPRTAFGKRELGLADALRRFGEFALSGVTGNRRPGALGIGRKFPDLTPREVLLTQLVLLGLSNKQLCRELDISLATVKTHLLNIFRKTGVRSRGELAARAFY